MIDPDTFVGAVREVNQTALSRLGSSKALYAETAGTIETTPVLEAAARAELAAAETFEAWAADEDHEAISEFFAEVAAEERDHYDRVTDQLDGEPPEEAVPALHEYLRERSDTVERLGAFVGRVLASKRSKEQVVGYFVGNADPRTAELFRGFNRELDDQIERALDLLGDLDIDEAAGERAQAAASDAIQAAYGEYVETLESMGANPKPVC